MEFGYSASIVDQEATIFAMELLMPTEWLVDDIRRLGGVDIEDERTVARLARRYRVSLAVMTVRLGMLMVP